MRSEKQVIDILNSIPAIDIVRKLAIRGSKRVYLVGDSLRDLFLEVSPDRFDFIVEGDPSEFAHKAAGLMQSDVEYADTEFGVYSCYSNKLGKLGFTSSEERSIPDFLERYFSFTINTLIFDINSGQIIDHHGSMADINSQIIRAVSLSNSAITCPGLLLNAVRLAFSTPPFTFEPETYLYIKSNKELIAKAPPSVIGRELHMILRSAGYCKGIQMLDDLGMLQTIFRYFLPFAVAESDDDLAFTAWVAKTYNALDSLTLTSQNKFVEHLPMMRQALLFTQGLKRQLMGIGMTKRKSFLVSNGELLERALINLSGSLYAQQSQIYARRYAFRFRMVATGYLIGVTSLSDQVDGLERVIDWTIKTFGPYKGVFSAYLIVAEQLAYEMDDVDHKEDLRKARELLQGSVVRLSA